MNNGLIILQTILIPIVIISIFFIFQNKKHRSDAFRLKTDWSNFNKAIHLKHQKDVIKYGNLVLWNTNLDIIYLNKMINLIQPLAKNDYEINKLLQSANNKKLDWTSSRRWY